MKKYLAIICLLIMSGCTSPKPVPPTVALQPLPTTTLTRTPEMTAIPLPTSTSTSLPAEIPVATRPMQTLTTAPIPTVLRTASQVSLVGTPLPAAVELISRENYDHLMLTAQWGNGTIFDTAFAPDGSFFIVRSYLGLAIYDARNLEGSARWIEIPDHLYYRMMDVSKDGKFLLFTNEPWRGSQDDLDQRVFELSTGIISSDPGDHVWYQPAYWSADRWEDIVAVSPDGNYQLRTGIRTTLPGNPPDAVREMTDPQDGSLYYELADPLTYVNFGQNARPQGCDIQYFTPEGVEPTLMAPVQVEFASNSQSFAILYYAESYFGWKDIRVYNSSDGQLMATYGSAELPVVDFAYVPGQETLLVSYGDGSINLWDIRQNRSTWQSRDFQPYTEVAAVSSDGKSVLLSSKFGLEVRNLTDGSLQGEYDPTAFAVSPVENMMALGQGNGDIEIRSIPSGEIVRIFNGHQAEIYGMAFSPDGRYLASSSYDCTVRLWDMQAGQYVRSFEEPTLSWYGEETRMHSWKLVFIPGTDTLMGLGTWYSAVKWNVATGAVEEILQRDMERREYLFPAFADHYFYILDSTEYIDTGVVSGTFPPPAGFPSVCSPYGPETLDGKLRFTVGSEGLSGYICVINISDWDVIALLPIMRAGSSAPVHPGRLFISPDGTQLISIPYNGVIYVFQLDQNL